MFNVYNILKCFILKFYANIMIIQVQSRNAEVLEYTEEH